MALAMPFWGEDPGGNSGATEKKTTDRAVSIIKFIPGVPQLKAGKYFKGALLLGSFLGAIAGSFAYNHQGNQWYQKYQNSTNVEEIVLWRHQAEKSFKNRNLCLVGLFTVWFMHILDLKFFKSGQAGVKSDVGKNKIDIGFYYSF